MGNMSVDGLVSGLDTTTIISQLMQVEAQPQVLLKNEQASTQSELDVYRALNSRFDAVRAAAEALNQPAAWQATSATSSNQDVLVATAASTTPATSLSLNVTSLAAAHSVVSANSVASLTDVVATGPITIGSTTITDVGDGSLGAVVTAINGSSAGVTATAVQVAPNQYKLQISSKTSGAASAFTVDATNMAALGSFGVVTQGSDASVTVGTGPAAYTVTSSSNTITGLVDGLTLTVKATGTSNVNVALDVNTIAANVTKLVQAVNDANAYINSNDNYDPATKKAGVLLGDSSAERLGQSLVDALINPVSGASVLPSAAGITLNSDGTITFDQAAFTAAFTANPSGVAQAFQVNGTSTSDDGIAERLRLAGVAATDPATGSITAAINARTDEISSLGTQISDWDERLAKRQDDLKTQFASLETALGTLKNQSSWLAGQIASLPQG
jgi:flagellar hook-associated protein 2